MQRVPTHAHLPWLLGAAFLLGPGLSGCGSSENQTVMPEVSPSDSAKDSMNYYRNQQAKKGTQKATKGAPKQ